MRRRIVKAVYLRWTMGARESWKSGYCVVWVINVSMAVVGKLNHSPCKVHQPRYQSNPEMPFFLSTHKTPLAPLPSAVSKKKTNCTKIIPKLYAPSKSQTHQITTPHPEAIRSYKMSRSIDHAYYTQPLNRNELSVGLDMHLPCRYAIYRAMKSSSPHQPNTDKRSSPSPERDAKSFSPPPRRPGVIYVKTFDKYGVVTVDEWRVATEVKQQIGKEKKGAVRRFVGMVRGLGRRMEGERKKGGRGRGRWGCRIPEDVVLLERMFGAGVEDIQASS